MNVALAKRSTNRPFVALLHVGAGTFLQAVGIPIVPSLSTIGQCKICFRFVKGAFNEEEHERLHERWVVGWCPFSDKRPPPHLKIAASTQSPSRVPQSPGGIYGHTDDVTEADSGGAIVVGDPNLGAKGPSLSSGSARSNDKRSRMQPAKGLKSH